MRFKFPWEPAAIWLAVLMHLVFAFLFLTTTGADGTLAFHAILSTTPFHSRSLAALILIAGSGACIFGLCWHRKMGWLFRFSLFVPQQTFITIVSLYLGFFIVAQPSFVGGVPRPPAFMFVSNVITVMFFVVHTCSILYWVRRLEVLAND